MDGMTLDQRLLEVANEQHPAGGALLAVAFDEAQPTEVRERALDAWDVLNVPGKNRWLAIGPASFPRALAPAGVGLMESWLRLFDTANRQERFRIARILADVCKEAAALDRARREWRVA
jgi:hypothetical protein